MRITIDIDERSVESVVKATGIRKRSPAIRRALTDYLADIERKRFIGRVMEGKVDYSSTNDELETRSAYDAD